MSNANSEPQRPNDVFCQNLCRNDCAANGVAAMLREKKTANVAFKTTESVQDDLTKRAHLAGLSVSEYLHNLVLLNLYGRDHVESLYRRMLCVVSGPADKDLPETSLRAVAK